MSFNKPVPKPLITDPSNPYAMTNVRIANLVRSNAGLDYQSRVPAATQGDVQRVIDQLDSYTPDWNVFINVLLNGLVVDLFRVNDFTNPLGRFKMAGTVDNGTWIRELGYGLIKAKHYDKHATDVFTVEEPEVHTAYHVQDRQDRYDLSTSEDILRQAMQSSETGVATMINTMMGIPYISAEEDEYLIMREMIAARDRKDPYWNVNIPDITTGTPEERKNAGLQIMQKIREVYLQFKFLHTTYNPEGLPAKCDDPILFMTPAGASNSDVNVLSQSFNMEKADFVGRQQLVDQLPLDGIKPTDACFILADPGSIIAADTKVKSASIYNPKNDTTNYFLHRWGIYSMSRFTNMVLFSSRPDSGGTVKIPTVTKVTPSISKVNGTAPTYVDKGNYIQLEALVEGTDYPNQAVTWEIIGTSGISQDSNTYIKGNGQLWISTAEQNTWLLIRATSIADGTQSGTLRVGIGAEAPDINGITAVKITGSATIKAGTTDAYTAAVTGDPSNNVIWAVYGAANANTKIGTDGTLTVDKSEGADEKLTVVATSRLDPTVSATLTVTVQAAA